MSKDNVYGALLGAAIGDACGAPLEFYNGEITDAIANITMTFPGGGWLNVKPGQVTDDFELTRSLANVLVEYKPNHGFPRDEVARAYIKWLKSSPIDMGTTCRNAFTADKTHIEGGIGEHMKNVAKRQNMASESNGALMRSSAVAAWCRDMSDRRIVEHAREDALLSHPNDVCVDSNIVYILAMTHLMKNKGDAKGALEKIEEYIRTSEVNEKVKKWVMVDSKEETASIVCTENIGWAKHALTLTIHFLRNQMLFDDVLKVVLMKGGDVDTNCCIVMAMMGALYGESVIAERLKRPVLSCQVRPEYSAFGLESLALKFM